MLVYTNQQSYHMEFERRTLYNLLRLNWLNEPSLAVQPWQVEDYRACSLENLFTRLGEKGFFLDRVSFLALADALETPEDLVDDIFLDGEMDAETQDQIYLLIFEIWRRLVPEKLCLSIFCDELDYQIERYDRGDVNTLESIQDCLANLEVILQDNVDHGGSPREVFESINFRCANDLESFLYDFIADQIDNKNILYASELLEDFMPYVIGIKWFTFLKARVTSAADVPQALALIRHIILEQQKEPDAEFYLEVLSFLAQEGDRDLFVGLVKQTLPLLELEEEFQDILAICAEYFQRLDLDTQEQAVQKILHQRAHIPLDHPFNTQDPHTAEVLKTLENAVPLNH